MSEGLNSRFSVRLLLTNRAMTSESSTARIGTRKISPPMLTNTTSGPNASKEPTIVVNVKQ